jgi:hypothetical protein
MSDVQPRIKIDGDDQTFIDVSWGRSGKRAIITIASPRYDDPRQAVLTVDQAAELGRAALPLTVSAFAIACQEHSGDSETEWRNARFAIATARRRKVSNLPQSASGFARRRRSRMICAWA